MALLYHSQLVFFSLCHKTLAFANSIETAPAETILEDYHVSFTVHVTFNVLDVSHNPVA